MTFPSPLEISANTVNLLSILLAGRNSVHTWWTGILGCLLFGWLFLEGKLYADTTLQLFFIASSVCGWRAWRAGADKAALPVTATPLRSALGLALAAVAVAGGYGWLLQRFTDAWSPFLDSMVLAFSVLGQFLLMARRIGTWPCWLIVNTLAVPLFYSRGLYVTAAFYACFWVNAVVSWLHWRRLLRAAERA